MGPRVLMPPDAKAEAIDSFNGNKNTTNFWRERTTTTLSAFGGGGGLEKERRRDGRVKSQGGWCTGCRGNEEKRKAARARARDVTSRRHSD